LTRTGVHRSSGRVTQLAWGAVIPTFLIPRCVYLTHTYVIKNYAWVICRLCVWTREAYSGHRCRCCAIETLLAFKIYSYGTCLTGKTRFHFVPVVPESIRAFRTVCRASNTSYRTRVAPSTNCVPGSVCVMSNWTWCTRINRTYNLRIRAFVARFAIVPGRTGIEKIPWWASYTLCEHCTYPTTRCSLTRAWYTICACSGTLFTTICIHGTWCARIWHISICTNRA
jgi:hypothetical protein